jgi:hypothetical protein
VYLLGSFVTLMRKRLKTVPMATVLATSFLFAFSTTAAWGESGLLPEGITATTDESGRKIFVNDGVPKAGGETFGRPYRRSLVYWSSKEHRWKPVPTSGAMIRAARSAASEVNTYLDSSSLKPESSSRPFTQLDIDAAIDQAAARHNVDPNLVRSVIKVESNFNPNAVSRKGAMGLMQLMPATARLLNVSNPFDPTQNVDAGVRHLRRLLDNYGGNLRLSLAAYNAGAGTVSRSAGVPRIAETQRYVNRITNLYTGGGDEGSHMVGSPVHDPVRVQRDARGVLHISNTE